MVAEIVKNDKFESLSENVLPLAYGARFSSWVSTTGFVLERDAFYAQAVLLAREKHTLFTSRVGYRNCAPRSRNT